MVMLLALTRTVRMFQEALRNKSLMKNP